MTITIQQVIEVIFSAIPGAPEDKTVDTVKIGDPSQEVTGIITTFLTTVPVIQEAIHQGANLIITHEPTFYNHEDHVDWLQDDPIYLAKRRLLEENHIVIWRFHDAWHAHQPDGILTGFIQKMGWEVHQDAQDSRLFHLPTMSATALASLLKEKLAIPTIRLVGNPNLPCRTIAVVPGAGGRDFQIDLLQQKEVDAILIGEVAEWETYVYTFDAVALGASKALLVLGHAASEESGMTYLVEWLVPRLPGVKVLHVPAGLPFKVV